MTSKWHVKHRQVVGVSASRERIAPVLSVIRSRSSLQGSAPAHRRRREEDVLDPRFDGLDVGCAELAQAVY